LRRACGGLRGRLVAGPFEDAAGLSTAPYKFSVFGTRFVLHLGVWTPAWYVVSEVRRRIQEPRYRVHTSLNAARKSACATIRGAANGRSEKSRYMTAKRAFGTPYIYYTGQEKAPEHFSYCFHEDRGCD
jgi:hypothetical protein